MTKTVQSLSSIFIFYLYLWREHEIGAILASTSVTMSIEKSHIITRHHDEEQTCNIALKLGWSLKEMTNDNMQSFFSQESQTVSN